MLPRTRRQAVQSGPRDKPTVHSQNMPTAEHPPVRDAYAAYTNQGFLGRETAATAEMLAGGATPSEVRRRVMEQNLFQLTSESSRKSTVNAVLARLDNATPSLLRLVTSTEPDTRRLTTLYVILLQHRLLREFVADVLVPIANLPDESVTQTNVSVFMQRVASQQPDVDAWSATTKQKSASNMLRVLTDAGVLLRQKPDQHTVLAQWVPADLRRELEEAGRNEFLKLLLDRGGAA